MTLFFFFFPLLLPLLFRGRGGGSSSRAQSNGVIQSSQPPGGTVLHQGNVSGCGWCVAVRIICSRRQFSEGGVCGENLKIKIKVNQVVAKAVFIHKKQNG